MNRKNKGPDRYQGLDEEETEILKAFDEGQLRPIKKEKIEISRLKRGAETHFKKTYQISIELSESDLNSIKERAAYEGLSYLDLASSVLHKYAAGHPSL
jgi:predicted DNA binding CopG/RHH family protein